MNESRSQLQSRLSIDTGISNLDRDRNVPILLQLTKSDIAVLKQYLSNLLIDLESLLSKNKVRGTKKLISEFKSLGIGCLESIEMNVHKILEVTKKKTQAVWLEKALIQNQDKKRQKLASAHEKFASYISKSSNLSPSNISRISCLSTCETIKDKVEAIIGKVDIQKKIARMIC